MERNSLRLSYVVMRTPFCRSTALRVWDDEDELDMDAEWRMPMQAGGHHRWNSRRHWRSSVAGHTISDGAAFNPEYRRPPRNVIAWIVLPRPISSPIILP